VRNPNHARKFTKNGRKPSLFAIGTHPAKHQASPAAGHQQTKSGIKTMTATATYYRNAFVAIAFASVVSFALMAGTAAAPLVA
jgi:hypothetical protein